VEFTLEYTQPLEILPFIKRWLPDVEIISPSSLQDVMIDDLKLYIAKKL
jgi:predicted DNA-binding transcriptional regulator YafY